MDPDLSRSLLATVAAAGGALGVRVFDLIAGRQQREADEAAKIRGELRADLAAAREQVAELRRFEHDYWALYAEFERWKFWLGHDMMGPNDPTATRGLPPAKPNQ